MTPISRQVSRDAGFTLTELLVASVITITVTAAVFAVIDPVHGIFRVQPDVADLQQRMRVGVDALTRDLMMAGGGMNAGAAAGPLVGSLASVLPYRIGVTNSDAVARRFYRSDAVTILYVPPTASQTTIRHALTATGQELQVNIAANCPQGRSDGLCGFDERMRVLIGDAAGAWDVLTITDLEAPIIRVQYAGPLSTDYAAGAWITQIVARTYYLKTDVSNDTFQLMVYDGYQTDLPLVDHVVHLQFAYFGDPQPPALLPGKALDDAVGPFTTYGPRPPLIDGDNPNDSWPAGENCVFTADTGVHRPRLPVLAVGNQQVELQSNALIDGPWCIDAEHVNRFDADLLRIRRVRIRMRVQAAAASMRGPAGVLFTRGGTASASSIPDHELSFDVTPRNLNLTR